MVVIIMYIPFILLIPTLGYASKKISSFFIGIKLEKS
jgi:hypothetical protein